MRKRIFIHIGTHRTGSASIQYFLNQNRAALKAAGILVPHAGTGIATAPMGHHNIAYELCGDPNFDRNLPHTAQLIAELCAAREEVAVISSANLQFLHRFPEKLKSLDTDLDAAGYARIYLVYFRNPEAYFLSMFTQLKRTGRLPDGTFASLHAQMVEQGYIVDRVSRYFEFDDTRFMQAWQAIVGPRVVRVDYDHVADTPGLVESFLIAIGAPDALVQAAGGFPRQNVTRLGRNDHCPCQSGKRYKHCHGVLA